MAMNKIQFQAGLSMREFQRRYGTDEQCEAALFASRWPAGWSCPRCQGTRYACTHNGRRLWECLGCGYQCSSIVGTVFEHTKLPLSIWFLAIYLMTQSKNAVSALELKRQLGVSYKTAWLVKHKLLQTMLLREAPRRLDERVEIDDAYLGGEKPGKRGRGSENKTAFVAAVQTLHNGQPRFIRLTPVARFTHEAIKRWAAQSLAPTAHVVSDGLWCFQSATHTAATHERHVTGHGRQAVQRPEFHWVNTLLGNLKTALSGTYHSFNHAKYAHRYLAEFAYRFNRRFDLAAMVPRLLRAAVTTKPLPLSVLRVSEPSN
ncbi:MAG: IS1595 family transposase [Candidimonas sp.]|nr:MAG: IS1595 family transposase [Candidimonas sp.]